MVLSFSDNFLVFLGKKKNTVILKTLKISEKSNGRSYPTSNSTGKQFINKDQAFRGDCVRPQAGYQTRVIYRPIGKPTLGI